MRPSKVCTELNCATGKTGEKDLLVVEEVGVQVVAIARVL